MRDHRRAAARHRGRGQRLRVPGPAGPARRWARIVSCNPAEILDPRAAGVLGLRRRRPHGLGRVLGGVRRPRDRLGGLRRVLPRARRAGAARARFIHESPDLNLYLYPGRGRLPAGAAARPDVAPHRHVRARGGRRGRTARRHPPRRRLADLPVARLARLGRRRPDAAALRRAGRHAAPLHRLEGPAGRRDHAPRPPVGRRVPAAADPDAALRPGHHARRQQHRPPSASTTGCR